MTGVWEWGGERTGASILFCSSWFQSSYAVVQAHALIERLATGNLVALVYSGVTF